VTYKETKQKFNIRLLKSDYTRAILTLYMQKDLFYQERFFIKSNQLNNQMTTKKWRKRNKRRKTRHQRSDLPGQQEIFIVKADEEREKNGTLTRLLFSSCKFGLTEGHGCIHTLLNINTRIIGLNGFDQWLIRDDNRLCETLLHRR
jgi:hypothetical protein